MEPLFDIGATMAVDAAHIREVGVFRESHGDAVGIVAAEIFGEIGAHLFDRCRSASVPLGWLCAGEGKAA